MITNSICPYCMVEMVKAENQDNSRSVEHLIPNAALTGERKKDQGDFYVCRKCNIKKSKVDELIGAIAKVQSSDEKMAAKAMIKVITRHKNIPKRFEIMLGSAERHRDGVHFDIPISGDELVEYLTFLGKGVYFKKYHKPYLRSQNVMLFNFCNKAVSSSFTRMYKVRHGSNLIRDLEKYPDSEVIADGECVIWSKNKQFLIVLHDYMFIGIEIKSRNRKNEKRELENIQFLLTNDVY